MTNRREFLIGTAGSATCSSAAPRAPEASSVFEPTLFELRNYATRPGRRDALIAMFERSFLDAYEAGGTRVIGTFRNLDAPDVWVWMRAFRDAASRGQALANFYASTAWRRESGPANATIADASNALLLRLASGQAAAAPVSPALARSVILVDIYVLGAGTEDAFAAHYQREAAPMMSVLGGAPFATFVTDRSPNSFPRQRVRTDTVFVSLTRFETLDACAAFEVARDASEAWRTRIQPEIASRLIAPSEILRLQPTARSALR